MPRHVQKDPEASHTWLLKDDLVRRGKVYYGKLSGARTTFIAPRMIPYFNAVWGLRRAGESRRLGRPARAPPPRVRGGGGRGRCGVPGGGGRTGPAPGGPPRR